MRRGTSPVQQWVDSIPSYGNGTNSSFDRQTLEVPQTSADSLPSDNSTTSNSLIKQKLQRPSDMTASTAIKIPNSPAITTTGPTSSAPHNKLVRDLSLQSDSSHCSSVESLLEWRKPDPEAILLGLGFGYPNSPRKNGTLARIPKRFLQPSKLKGIAINDFLKQQQESSESLDTASLGFRGLTGSPYVAPSEIVQKIMERLREHENQELESHTNTTSSTEFGSTQQDGRLSVLSPDNRQYLERPRSKSPDMRNKRMIIGQKSFAFGYNGDLIEIKSFDTGENNSEDQSSEAITNENPSEIPQQDKTLDMTPTIERPANMSGRKLAKQESFDENNSGYSLDMRDGDEASPSCYQEESLERRDSLATVVSSESESATLSTRKSVDRNILNEVISGPISRRASDSLYDLKSNRNAARLAEGRRLSDGTIQTRVGGFNRESVGIEKRRFSDRKPGLKRQANVNDVDLMNYESVIDKENSIRCSSSPEKIGSDVSTEKIPGDNWDGEKVKSKPRLEEEEGEEEEEEKEEEAKGGYRLCCPEDKEQCCKNDELDRICEHKESSMDCCCHTSSTNCWRKKAKKMMKKNQKLEGIVAKKRQEIAEMREMLNSVMSVRMEPGF